MENVLNISVNERISVTDKISEQVRKFIDRIINGFRVVEKRVSVAIDMLLSMPNALARPPTTNNLAFNVKLPKMVYAVLGSFILVI